MQDGAQCLQRLVYYRRADAVRILDFAHAAEYISEIGEAVQAAGGRLPQGWLTGVLHRLKQERPSRVLKHLAWLATHYPSQLIQEKLTYLQKRQAHMQYPRYQQAGWPIGSGRVESANKLVVEARLKGAGMRWERHNVNPMLVLRNAVCNRRWHESWTAARVHQRGRHTQQRQAASNLRISRACWTLAFWSVRLASLPHRLAPVLASPPVPASRQPPALRLGAPYSWRNPFLRRPPSSAVPMQEVDAKK